MFTEIKTKTKKTKIVRNNNNNKSPNPNPNSKNAELCKANFVHCKVEVNTFGSEPHLLLLLIKKPKETLKAKYLKSYA